MKTIKTFDKIAQMKGRVKVVQGGTSAGKTYSILQILITLALRSNKSKLVSIVAESVPHLKRGALRDFIKILEEDGIYKEENHNKSENTYKLNKWKFEFFGGDQPDKMRGARRDILFMNECNNMTFETYNQLEVRTKDFIFLDYNPTVEFWVHDHILGHDDSSFLIVTYKDNSELDENIVKSIEKRKPVYENGILISGDENWWRVYGLGETGVYDGLVFKNWNKVDGILNACKFLGYGLDFGYTNDPTALIGVWKLGDELWYKEFVYEKELTNSDIADRLDSLGIDKNDQIIADSSEPKSIEELCRRGYNVKPCKKGKDSINYGIDLINSNKFNVTTDSYNLIEELRRYCWIENKEGKTLNKPIDNWNHAIDAMRYATSELIQDRKEVSKSSGMAYLRRQRESLLRSGVRM